MKASRKSGFTLVELIIVIGLIIILSSLVGAKGCANASHGTGQKIGQVVKFSKQGFFSATWEGELIRGGMNNGSGTVGTVPFNFTVEDPNLVKRVEDYMLNQTEVVVRYKIEGLYSPFRSESSGHFLTSIEPIAKSQK